MPDWTKPMKQTFNYYIVDPVTWKNKEKINDVISSNIDRDGEAETLGSATFDINADLGECYIRAYLVTIQNGITEEHPLGTFLVQTPKMSFNGQYQKVSIDAYTPLLELKENPPPIGYTIMKNQKVMTYAYRLTREHVRAPVVELSTDDILYSDFVANTSDSWLTYISDLLATVKYKLGLDELSRIIYMPDQDLTSLQPVWIYNDDNSSILYPDISLDHDLYGIPNVVEVIYTSKLSNYYARVVNDDPDSPTSTVNRGREIVKRITDPDFSGEPTKEMLEAYASEMLKQLSGVEYTVSYTHGYCPVRLGDCVRLNYTASGIKDVKAKVIRQQIECSTGCKVTETAVYTANLWR